MYATIFVSILIIIAVLIPGSKLPDVHIGGYDKLIHMAMFCAWVMAVQFDLNKKSFPTLKILVAGLIFSGLTEILQLLIEGRSFDIYDMAADAVGLVFGLLIGAPLVNRLRK